MTLQVSKSVSISIEELRLTLSLNAEGYVGSLEKKNPGAVPLFERKVLPTLKKEQPTKKKKIAPFKPTLTTLKAIMSRSEMLFKLAKLVLAMKSEINA